MGALVCNVFQDAGLILGHIGELLGALIYFLIFSPFILIWIGVAGVGLFAETAFKKLAGIDTIYLNGQPYSGGSGDGTDLVYAFITDNAVQNVFWSILALSLVLLFILTIVALIKSEFTLDPKGSAKAPIIGRALKSFANFLIIPVTTLISIIAMNFVTTSVYNMFGTEDSSIVSKCFALGAYNANRARLSEDFATALSTNRDSTGYVIYLSGTNPFEGKSQDEIATLIDEYFASNYSSDLVFNDMQVLERVKTAAGGGDSSDTWGGLNLLTLFLGYPNTGNFYWNDIGAINYYYNIAKFDYILGLGSIIVMAWTLLTVCLVLVKRVFEMTILFLLSPVMTAIAPLDGGQAEKKWRQEFMKRLLATIGPIFAFNMYFLLIPLFENINLFSWGATVSKVVGNVSASSSTMGVAVAFLMQFNVFNLFFQVVCILVGLSVIKSASGLLSNLLGIDDLIKSGSEAAKAAVDKGKAGFKIATAVGGVALKGAATVIKAGKGVVSGIKNRKDTAKSRNDAKDQLGGAQKAADEAGNYLDLANQAAEANWKNTGHQATLDWLEEKEKKGSLNVAEKNRLSELRSEKYDMLNSDLVQQRRQEKEQADKNLDYRKSGVSEAEQKVLEAKDIENEKAQDIINNPNSSKEAKKEARKTIDKNTKYKEKMTHTSVWGNIKEAYESEYGEDSGKSNAMGRGAKFIEDKFKESKISKVPILGKRVNKTLHSATEYFNISGDTATRRLNDALAGMFGETGGQLWKINFNKNARASLYEGVPEDKAREQKIQQEMLMEARNNYDKSEKDKGLKNEELKNLAKYFAEQMHDPKYNQLESEKNAASKAGDTEKASKIDAQISQRLIDMGAMKKARDFLPQSETDEGYKKWKTGIKDEAEHDAFTKESKEKSRVEGQKLKVVAEMANGSVLKTKQDKSDIENMAKAVKTNIDELLKKGIRLNEDAIEKFKDALTSGLNEESKKIVDTIIGESVSKLKQ